jgi:hypothetical protein
MRKHIVRKSCLQPEYRIKLENEYRLREIELLKLKCRYIELRYREDQPQDDHGRWVSEGGGSAGLTEGGASGKIRAKAPKMSSSEVTRVSHQIATDHPELKADGIVHCYESRNYFYTFSVQEFGCYTFRSKIPIAGNEEKIKSIRISLGEWG